MDKRKAGIRNVALAIAAWGLVFGTAGHARAAGTSLPTTLHVTKLLIVTGHQTTSPEVKAAEILKARLLRRSAVSVETASETAANLADLEAKSDVVIALGLPGGNALVAKWMREMGAALPTLPNSDTVHPESFIVHSGKIGGKDSIVIAGEDGRAVIYGVGWLLRAMTYDPTDVIIPVGLNASEKPAFQLRGGQPTGPGSRARKYGKLRPQTPAEHREIMEDQMLLGTNIFGGDPKVIHQYGMMTIFGRTANALPGGFPKDWGADSGESTRYVCPSVPAARKALLESFDKMFKNMPDYDFFTTNSGDSGGCRCPKCMPWGGTYIKLVHQIADLLHKYHPNCKVMATNQDLTNAGNQALFQYLNTHDSSWLYAIRYGPGADEMQTYIRGPVNPRWFKYEGFGPTGNYLKYMFHELPRTTTISLYTDITHWMQSQYGVAHPDIALAAVYERRSWNARPRTFHRIAREIFHYAVGGVHYSEGMHDDFNKWVWYRMLWNPNQSAEALTRGYCRYWFGPAAEDDMTKAIFLMEKTLEKPVLDNPGIEQAVELTRAAGAKIPENLKKIDYRWRIISQKALMDRYIQLELQRGLQLKFDAAPLLTQAETSTDPGVEVSKALKILKQPIETPEMKSLKDEALQLGVESNRIIGYRVPAPFIVGTLDLTEVGWWKKELGQALADGNAAKLRNTAKMVVDYEDPGQGGFYDNVGWPNESKHLIHGETLWGFMPYTGPARRSYYDLAYARGLDKPGVTFKYHGLDPKAQYVVRVSVGAHLAGTDLPVKNVKLSEGLKANGEVISDGFAVPSNGVTMYEFDLPQKVTAGGTVEIAFTAKPGPFPITAVYEIWLMRKDHMPWTARM